MFDNTNTTNSNRHSVALDVYVDFAKTPTPRVLTAVNVRGGWGVVLEGEGGARCALARFTTLGNALRKLRALARHADEVRLAAPGPVWSALYREPLPARTARLPLAQPEDDPESAVALAWNLAEVAWWKGMVLSADAQGMGGETDKWLPWDADLEVRALQLGLG